MIVIPLGCMCVSDLAILFCACSVQRECLLYSVLASAQIRMSMPRLLVQCTTVNLDLY